MLAQLAQFSSLEQMENLNTSFEAVGGQLEFLNGNVDQLNFLNAQGMIGRYVEGVNPAGEAVRGTVESVTLQGSIVVLTVDGPVEEVTLTNGRLVCDGPFVVARTAGIRLRMKWPAKSFWSAWLSGQQRSFCYEAAARA